MRQAYRAPRAAAGNACRYNEGNSCLTTDSWSTRGPGISALDMAVKFARAYPLDSSDMNAKFSSKCFRHPIGLRGRSDPKNFFPSEWTTGSLAPGLAILDKPDVRFRNPESFSCKVRKLNSLQIPNDSCITRG